MFLTEYAIHHETSYFEECSMFERIYLIRRIFRPYAIISYTQTPKSKQKIIPENSVFRQSTVKSSNTRVRKFVPPFFI